MSRCIILYEKEKYIRKIIFPCLHDAYTIAASGITFVNGVEKRVTPLIYTRIMWTGIVNELRYFRKKCYTDAVRKLKYLSIFQSKAKI